ncbi:MAG: polyprenyl synthetase family protein [Bacteroidota bacterium]
MYKAKELRHLLDIEINSLSNSIVSKPIELYEPIQYTLQLGGKRIRPVLVLLGCEMFGGNVKHAVPAALGIELFHNFTLLHDDIMDNAPLRRGKETVHEKWNSNIAILSGDTMFVKACQQFLLANTTNTKQVLDCFFQTAVEVCEGQQLDMNFETQSHVKIDDYIEMIRLKTAVLLGGALKIGAYIGNASEENANWIYHFGMHIGIAFQLQDDILDVFGDAEKVGKQVGGDIISNKKTFLLLKAIELCNAEQSKELNNWINKKEFNAKEKVTSVTNIYNELNVRELAEQEMNNHFEIALNYLKLVNVSTENKYELDRLAHKLMEREY